MDGVAIIREVLATDPALTAIIPADQIIGGIMPADTPLDAISVTRVSAVDLNMVAEGASRHVTERVQVTVVAKTYPGLRTALKAAKKAAAGVIGNFAGVTEVTIHTDSAGPDFSDEQATLHMGSQDFMVGYNEAT